MSKLVKFNDDTSSGATSEKAILKTLPEGITSDTLTAVDSWREEVMSRVATEAIDYAEKHTLGTGIHVGDVHLGGQATGYVYIDPSYKVVIETEFRNGDLLSAVLARSIELYERHNYAGEHEPEPELETEE